MIAIIFEVWPKADEKQNYLEMAAVLRKELEQVDGFISVERFESITEPGKMLSLSFFEDEAAVDQWRNLSVHRAAQSAGRNKLFSDYRLRVSSVMRDYGTRSVTGVSQSPSSAVAILFSGKSIDSTAELFARQLSLFLTVAVIVSSVDCCRETCKSIVSM